MPTNRFTRFKALRELWRRAKQLLAWFYGPQDRAERLRMSRWQQVNIAERLLRDGQMRGTGDPESYLVPPGTSSRGADEYARQAHLQAQREWYHAAQVHELHQRQEQLARHQSGRRG